MRIPSKHQPKWKKLVDASVNLTPGENRLLYDTIDNIVRKIVRREKNPLKRRILRQCIVSDAELSANAAFGEAEKRLWKRTVKENAKKEKKLAK